MAQQHTIMTYNVENLFDTQHDVSKEDMDFLPNSERHWTKGRFYNKVHEVMQVIVGAGGEELPMIVGLCEVENDNVLRVMTGYEPYDQLGYDYVHYEGPDARGIDVAILYRRDLFMPISSRPVPVTLPGGKRGRDLLYVMGSLNDGTILHLIQVHFPSRREGAEVSEPNRIAAAKVVNNLIDSVHRMDNEAGIVIMGDFNDNPSDYVPSGVLKAGSYMAERFESDRLYNLCYNGRRHDDRDRGSYFHAGEWDMLDQIMVSGSLLNGALPITIEVPAQIYSPKWITHYDQRNHARIPDRTYRGPHYTGGVSDHFPVYVRVRGL